MTTEYSNDICIVGGAGRVGLPLALTFADEGFRVVICDINEASLRMIRDGQMPFAEKGADDLLARALAEGRLDVSSDPASAADAATVIVTIGTPADELTKPILSTFKSLADDLLPHLSDDQLVVLRSTVSPGTTDWLYDYLRANGRNPKVSFCPERIVQGQAVEEIRLLTQIVSGATPEAEWKAAALFERISPRIVRLTPIEAEFAKLFSNAYRYIQFATANQFYMIANAAGVDYSRVLEGMKKDYPRARDIPPAGLRGGPVPAEGHHAAGRVRQRRFHPGTGGHERQPGPGELPRRGGAEPLRRPAPPPRRPAWHGLQGGQRRRPVFAELQIEGHPGLPRQGRC